MSTRSAVFVERCDGGIDGDDAFPVAGLAEMFELAPNFMAMLSGPQHCFVQANPAYLRLVGREAVVGKTVGEVLPEIADQGFLAILDRVYETDEPFTATEMPIQLDIGGKLTERYVSFVYQPVHSAEGAVCGIAAHGMDVTDHVRARSAIEEREAYYESLLAHSDDKMNVTAPDGTILYESASVERLLGWTSAELIGTNAFDLIHPDDAAAVQEQMNRLIAQPGHAVLMDVRLRHRDGRWKDFETIGHVRVTKRGPEIVSNSRDVSRRKAAERSARASEERFRTVAATMPDGFMLFRSVRDDAGSIVDFEWDYTNEAGAALVNRTHEDLLGSRLLAEMAELPDVVLFRELVRVVETGVPLRREFTHRDEVCPRTYRCQAVRVEDGFAATFSDITEAHVAQQELREREERFRALVELIPQLVWSTTPDGYHDYFNQRWYDYTGMKATGDQGWNWKDFLHPDDYERTLADWTHSLQTGQPYHVEYRFRRGSDGAYRWFIGRALPLRDAGGNIVRWFGTCTDIDDERRALESARQSEERFLALTRATKDVIWDWDLGTDVFWWNDNMARVLLHDSERKPKTLASWADGIHPDDRERVLASVRGAIASGDELWVGEYRFIRGDGSIAQINDRGLLIHDAEGKRTRMIGSMQDVTDRNQLEEELRQTQKLEAIGKLAGGIAHDFNNLLTVITSYSELVLSELAEEAAHRADIEEIRRAANRASALTRQLLAFSRRQVLQPRDLDLNGVVASVESMLGRIIGEGITLIFNPGENVGTVRADPGQLEQVLLNLAVNARDAMPEGGTLTLATSRLMALHAAAGDFVQLTVADTGIGMDEATIARAFEPFFTTKSLGDGTGLGLSTVHGIVTQSGGRIEVDSAPGVGTTFRIFLPVVNARAQQQEETPAGRVAAGTASGTILLVEDEEAVRLIVRRTLTRQGYVVVEACNGVEALRILKTRSEDIDLILTDLVMPEMGGRKLVKRVRELYENPPHVVYMSGYAETDALPVDDFGGGDVLLEKPFTIQELLAVVGRATAPAGR